MRCYCIANESSFDLCVEGALAQEEAALEAAWFKREGNRYVKRYPSGFHDQEIVSKNFPLLGPSMFKQLGNWEDALYVIAQVCKDEDIRWAITGSVSESVIGVAVDPHDIDIVVHTEDFYKAREAFIHYLVEPFVDTEGTFVVRYFGRLCIRGVMVDVVADESRNFDNHPYDDAVWRGISLKVEPLMDRLIIELHRKREDRIRAIESHYRLNHPHSVALGIIDTVNFLNSEEALKGIDKDPYWPKWHSAWWHMSVLYEMGLSPLIPSSILDRMVLRMNERYLKIFPIYDHEFPEGLDYYTRVPCHCQLGNMYQILRSCRVDIDDHLPWIRPWFLSYQLPDGGLNCEDDAYRHSKKSSIASTLPVLESWLMLAEADALTASETRALESGIQYLIAHRLVYKTSGELMDESFLKLQFPRFYSYDILRGLSVLSRWHALFGHKNEALAAKAYDVISEAAEILNRSTIDGQLHILRSDLFQGKTRAEDSEGHFTLVTEKTCFPLLNSVGKVNTPSPYLTWQFNEAMGLL